MNYLPTNQKTFPFYQQVSEWVKIYFVEISVTVMLWYPGLNWQRNSKNTSCYVIITTKNTNSLFEVDMYAGLRKVLL